MAIKRMTDLNLAGKRVLIREDLNVPVKDGKVSSDARIRASLPTIRHAVDAGARADINHMVGGSNGVFIVLDDNYRVAQITQVGEGGQQAVIVPLVEPDGGFVENVHDAYQSGADLARQADPLAFAAGQGAGCT